MPLAMVSISRVIHLPQAILEPAGKVWLQQEYQLVHYPHTFTPRRAIEDATCRMHSPHDQDLSVWNNAIFICETDYVHYLWLQISIPISTPMVNNFDSVALK